MAPEFRIRRRVHQAGVLVSLSIAVCVLGMPFFWMAATALKPASEAITYPPQWLPSAPKWSNFSEAWNAAPFARFYINSIVSSVCATLIQVGFALLMGYAFAWIACPGKNYLLLAVLATMMVPEELKLIPNYFTLERLGWIDTLWALIVPPAAHAFPVFVFHQHFLTIPRDLIDAARADGAGHLRILWSVCLPMSGPVTAAVVLVAFLGRWNDLLWPLIATHSESVRTLPVGLLYLQGSQEAGVQWNLLMAGVMFVIMPVLAIVFAAQRYFNAGYIAGGLKG